MHILWLPIYIDLQWPPQSSSLGSISRPTTTAKSPTHYLKSSRLCPTDRSVWSQCQAWWSGSLPVNHASCLAADIRAIQNTVEPDEVGRDNITGVDMYYVDGGDFITLEGKLYFAWGETFFWGRLYYVTPAWTYRQHNICEMFSLT